MVHGGGSDDSELVKPNPAPVFGRLLDLDVLNFLRGVDVEYLIKLKVLVLVSSLEGSNTYLNDSTVSRCGSDSNDVVLSVHEDAIGLHVSAVDLEALRRVHNCDLLESITESVNIQIQTRPIF